MSTRPISGRRSARVIVPLVFGLSVVVAFALAARTEEPTVAPAKAGQQTYALSDFTFVYPFRATGSSEDSAPSEAFAGVAFRSEWVGDTFPGDGECQIMLHGADGAVVGTWYLLITTLEPTAWQGPSSVDVTGPPSSATAWCGAASAPSGEYRFTDIAITDDPDTRHGPKITGTILAPTGTAGTHDCIAQVQLADGSISTHEFTLSAGDGSRLDVLLPPSLSTATSETVSCDPYTGSLP
jgi:hypothetical protein